MKVKKYNEQTYNELVQCLYRNIDGGNCLFSLLRSLDRAVEKYPEIKNIFIHDMNTWLGNWFELVNDSQFCSKKLRSKILSIKFATQGAEFNRLSIFCYDVATGINPIIGKPYGEDLMSFLACTVKAIIQTKRRELGLDTNSKKYGAPREEIAA